MKLADIIVDLFEELLDEKGIEIPCADETEQRDRYEGDNEAKLYGMEYWGLVENIESLLEEKFELMRKMQQNTIDDEYDTGFFNGIEYCLALLEGRDEQYRQFKKR